ncbi:MAG TPA: hypothetical protein DCZ71_04075 [Ruminococcus sp.]|nr:hypothetical protein [Ruminococcus sp.]
MKKVFSNIWTKRLIALIGALYAVGVCRLCYFSIFYDMHIESRTTALLSASFISLIALLLMLYSRKQIVTRIASFLILPAMLPVILLYFGEWEIIIPIVITGVVILLLSGAGEGVKTAMGTIILLLYIFGALGYFLFTSFFVSSAKETVVDSGVSLSEKYRYRIVNTEDTSNGSTAVYVEPNDADVRYSNVTFTLKNMERVVYLERPITEDIEVEWKTETRDEITKALDGISHTISVTLSTEKLKEFGESLDSRLELDDLSIDERFMLGQTAHDVDPVRLDKLNDEQLDYFNLAKDADGRYSVKTPSSELLEYLEKGADDTIYITDLDSKALKILNQSYQYAVLSLNNKMLLKDLDDTRLEALGVSEEGDVMIFNGKVCFRYYVAELDNYYDTETRKLSLDLLG